MLKLLFTRILSAICGQPDLLRNSRSAALRKLLAQEPMKTEERGMSVTMEA